MSRAKDPVTGLTAQQERFAQLVAAGATLSDAYRQAYNVRPGTPGTTYWDHASELARHALVKPRIAALKADIEAATLAEIAWSQAKLVTEADRHRKLALSGGWRGVASANGALELIGKVTGLLTEKGPGNIIPIQINFIIGRGYADRDPDGEPVIPGN